MLTITCKCNNCGKDFEKPLNEYNRKKKLNTKMYCSRACAGKQNLKNLGDLKNNIPPKNTYRANPFLYYIRNCKRRFKDFNLTVEYLEQLWNKQQGICPYTGINLLLNSHMKRHKDVRFIASLDRIDNSKGYVEGNVQFISMVVNLMKYTLSHEETIEFLQIISSYYSSFNEDRTISSPSNEGQDAVGSP